MGTPPCRIRAILDIWPPTRPAKEPGWPEGRAARLFKLAANEDPSGPFADTKAIGGLPLKEAAASIWGLYGRDLARARQAIGTPRFRGSNADIVIQSEAEGGASGTNEISILLEARYLRPVVTRRSHTITGFLV